MISSTTTLQNVIDALPGPLRQRHSTQFFVRAANNILREFERATDEDYFRDECGLLLREHVSEYELPSRVRRILDLYDVQRPHMSPIPCNNSSTFPIMGYEYWVATEAYVMNRQVQHLGNICVSRANGNLNHEPPAVPGTFEGNGIGYQYWNVFASLEAFNRYTLDLLS